MTTITREILELAALAAGRSHYRYCELWGAMAAYSDADGFYGPAWRPHADLGDTARLAVNMGIVSNPGRDDEPVEAWRSAWDASDRQRIRHDGTEPGRQIAWCTAVTLVAAAIGRRMKEQQ